jgi:hypothetical protein
LTENLQESQPKTFLLLHNKFFTYQTQWSLSYKKTSSTDTLLPNLQSRPGIMIPPPPMMVYLEVNQFQSLEQASDEYE